MTPAIEQVLVRILTILLEGIILAALAVPLAWAAWIWVKEEVFKELQAELRQLRDFYDEKYHDTGLFRYWLAYKIHYLPTCETCSSAYPTMAFVAGLGLTLIVPGFWGGVLAWLFTWALENLYMTIYSRIRIEKRVAEQVEKGLKANGEPDMLGARRGESPTDGKPREINT